MDYRDKVLNIAMNLNRIGNWLADDALGKKKRIKFFLEQTTRYMKTLDSYSFPSEFKKTFNRFSKEYWELVKDNDPRDSLVRAEKLMTWGNILTHRSKLLK